MCADIQVAIAKEFHARRAAGGSIKESKESASAAIASTIRDLSSLAFPDCWLILGKPAVPRQLRQPPSLRRINDRAVLRRVVSKKETGAPSCPTCDARSQV